MPISAICKIALPLEFSNVSRTQISVLRGLGQRLNKQKGLTSTVVETSPFVRMFYICPACQV